MRTVSREVQLTFVSALCCVSMAFCLFARTVIVRYLVSRGCKIAKHTVYCPVLQARLILSNI